MLELPTLQRLIDPLLPGLLGVRLIETGPEHVLAEGKLCAVVTQTQLTLEPPATEAPPATAVPPSAP